MSALLLILLLQTAPPSSVTVVDEVDEIEAIAPAPDSVWCVRYPEGQNRRRSAPMACRTLAEWDAVRRTRYDSRGYNHRRTLRAGIAIDSRLDEAAAANRVRIVQQARAPDPRP